MKRIINLIAAFLLIASAATAQSLSVANINATPGSSTTIAVNISGATTMTALQFNLSLPAGVTLANNGGNYGISLGSSAGGHTLSVQPLASGDYLVVLYNMYLNTFSDGTLLTIPVSIGNPGGTTSGSLYDIYMSTAAAVSHSCADVSFNAISDVPVSGITLDRTTATLVEGETTTLVATVSPDNASDKTVTWTSSNNAVVTVTNGVVTAVAPGTATITAKAGGKTATCTVTVKKNYVAISSLAELSNNKIYYISQPNHGKGATSWAVDTNGSALKSNVDLSLALDPEDKRQQFAILTSENGKRYLYHVAEKKFITKDGSLSATPVEAVKTLAGAYNETYFFYFDTDHYINVGYYQEMTIDSWYTPDGGNSCQLFPVGTFDSSAALAAINNLETAIDDVVDDPTQKVVYDLRGNRILDVEHMEKGVYIVNGQLMYVK